VQNLQGRSACQEHCAADVEWIVWYLEWPHVRTTEQQASSSVRFRSSAAAFCIRSSSSQEAAEAADRLRDFPPGSVVQNTDLIVKSMADS